MRKMFFAIIMLFAVTVCAQKLDSHRFGISLEGGFAGFPTGFSANEEPWHYVKGTAGGALFYQFHFSKMFAFRPEIGLYTYFFTMDGPQVESIENKLQNTLSGRLGLTLICYFYSDDIVSGYVAITPYITSRFWDSAGQRSDGKEAIKDDFFSGGGQTTIGIELTKAKPIGIGAFFFTRVADSMDSGGNARGVLISAGLGLSLFM